MKLRNVILGFVLLFGLTNQALAGLIVFSDRDTFEQAVMGNLFFEGLNGSADVSNNITLSRNKFSSASSLVSEGDKALSIKEDSTFTLNFAHDVFAFGFDLNELNATNLDYLDSAGNQIFDAFKVTAIFNESTFFGVISDSALRSFSLIGSSPGSLAVYGFDALTYTSPTTDVPSPKVFGIALLTLFIMCFRRSMRLKVAS